MTIVKQGDHYSYGYVELFCEKKADLAKLPEGVLPGSNCFCHEDGLVYIYTETSGWEVMK